MLANNLANADTPNYKARDLDFAAVLAEQKDKAARVPSPPAPPTSGISPPKVSAWARAACSTAVPVQIDQNTVDAQIEQANYAENAMHFQASFTFLNSKFKGLVSALRE